MVFGGFGITGGAHRLWSHGSYKAKWPLSILAAVGQTLALQVHFTFYHIFRNWNDVDAWASHYHISWIFLQQDIYQWCWNHRMHHKYSETDADPFNANRGFFYSHIGWIICEEHPEVKRRRNTIVMSDLEADPVVVYQRRWKLTERERKKLSSAVNRLRFITIYRFYVPLAALFGIALPIVVPCVGWNESRRASFFVAFVLRYILSLNITWMVNSVAHSTYWGSRPYDKWVSKLVCVNIRNEYFSFEKN